MRKRVVKHLKKLKGRLSVLTLKIINVPEINLVEKVFERLRNWRISARIFNQKKRDLGDQNPCQIRETNVLLRINI